MAGVRWLFTKEQLTNTPSIKCGMSESKESIYRQNAANFIQSMGQRLQLNQLCMNTAIVYMHRFYMYNALQKFHWRKMSAACLFLAAKVEEQPRKLELVIKASHHFTNRGEDGTAPPPLDTRSQEYLEKVQDLVINENILLQALGFNVTIDHSNTHVVKLCQLVKAPKELSQTSYFLSTNSLLLTNMCLQYSSTEIAAVCIHLACKWSDWELPRSKEGKYWWNYVDSSLTLENLETMTKEFLSVLERADPKLKKQLMARLKTPADSSPNSRPSSPVPTFSARMPPHVHQPPSINSKASNEKPHTSTKLSSPGISNRPAKTYAEHKERVRTSSGTPTPDLSNKSRALHGESPLARSDTKRPYPKESHLMNTSSSKIHDTSVNPPPPQQQHNPYNMPRNHDNRHYYRGYPPNMPMDGSPMKKARLGENGNGEPNPPPLPPQPPLPKPPLPP